MKAADASWYESEFLLRHLTECSAVQYKDNREKISAREM